MAGQRRPVALVTGVGRRAGIGAAIAERLARDGFDLALVWWGPYDQRVHGAEDPEGIASVVETCTGVGARVARIPADLADPHRASRVVQEATDALGPVGTVVLSHAESVDSDFRSTTADAFDRHMAVNARAPFLILQAYADGLRRAGDAVPREHRRVVALTSDHVAFNLPYGVSKGALDRVVLGAAKEFADLGVSANVLNPGPNDTGWMSDEVRADVLAGTPGGRIGVPTDTAAFVSFLCSPEGGWVNGQLLHSDGGWHNPL